MVSDDRKDLTMLTKNVLIRFEVRGGFRQSAIADHITSTEVSIRFEVRGGFRLGVLFALWALGWFQSALRFAVVSDSLLTIFN